MRGTPYKLAAEISHGWAEFIPRPLLCRFRTAIQILCENLDCKSERFSVESHRLMKAFFLVSMIWATSCSFAVDALDVWSLRYSGNRDLRFVRYTGGLFIAGGEGGRIVTSPDGLNWSQQTANTNTLLSAATSDGFSNFVAVGQTRTLPAPAVFRSSDGRSWSEHKISVWDHLGNVSTNLHQDVGSPQSVAFSGGSFVMGTSTLSPKLSTLFHSRDLTNWYEATPPELRFFDFPSYNALVPAKVSGEDVMVAAGSIWMPIRLGTLQHVNSEPVWSFQDVHPAGTGYVQTGAYGNGIFMLVGMEMPTLVSTNGRDWTKRIIGEPPVFPNNPTPNYMRLNYFVGNSVAFGNGTFVVPGSNDILVSTNGFWELRSIPIDSGSRYIAYGAGRFVIAGGKNIFASDHVSTPGLSVQRERGSLPKLHVSGEIGREYLLERSPDLITWTEADRLKLPLPKVEWPLDLSSPLSFYRASLLK